MAETKLYAEDIKAAIERLEKNPANAFLISGSDKNKVSNIVYLLLTAALEVLFADGKFRVPKVWQFTLWIRLIGIVIKLVKDVADIINGSKIEAVEDKPKRRRRKKEQPVTTEPTIA